MSSLLHYLRELREFATPLPTRSNLNDTGQITPSEFLVAGDALVRRNPLFVWKPAGTGRSVNHLPIERQYLLATKLPSYSRVADLRVVERVFTGHGCEGYCLPHVGGKESNEDDDDIVVVHGDEHTDGEAGMKKKSRVSLHGQGSSGRSEAGNDRLYSLCITYDKFYRTPRVFFHGSNRNGGSLSSEAMLEDVFRDYSSVVSLEPFAATNQMMMRIHPCQHATAMRNVINTLVESDGTYQPRVEHYLLIFLKIIACVIPTIEYDYE